jgi:hypothetical protein
MSRKKADRVWSDAEWEEFRKTLYERKRMRTTKLRQHEAARRKAGEPPPTLFEAIEAHLRTQPRIRRDTLRSPSVATSDNLAALAALFADDPVMTQIGEAAALSLEERLQKWGWLIGLPYGATVPPHMQHEDYRWEIPRWALAAKYDCGARDDYFCEIADGRMDKQRLDKIVADRKYVAKDSTKAKRALHRDELGLTPEQKAHLKRLRGRLANSERILRNVQGAMPERIAVAQAYVDSAVAAIKAARASCGLPEMERPASI